MKIIHVRRIGHIIHGQPAAGHLVEQRHAGISAMRCCRDKAVAVNQTKAPLRKIIFRSNAVFIVSNGFN